jgi:hypothetical protein
VLIHGGWWGPKYGADNLDRVAADLAGPAKLAAGAPGAAPTIHIAGVISLAGVLDLCAAAPRLRAHRLLADGERAVLIGGFGPEYDVITPVRVSAGCVEPAGIPPS